ncbi:MAG: serine/threonine-protein kinase [Nitrospirota bacterium]
MIGTQIGSYKIVEQIGEGGMGVVYRGVDTTLDRPVAIKVLSQELVGTPALVERFRAEAKAQANLNHTNIATLYSFMQVDGVCVMVMELLEGETFDQIIRRRGVIPAEEAVPLFRQALLGIGFAHRMGIVHRDIKPSNIMLTKTGIVKVMDFGIAKVLGGQRLTRTGTRMGTVAYMSPEQIRNLPVDIRSDIYSLGATLYEMFTAHLPFESESDFQVMSDHVNTPPTPPTRYYPYIAPGFEQCVLKALSKNPNDRFQTVEEFGAGLEHPLGLPGYVPAAAGMPVAWNQPGAPAPAQQGGWTPPGTPTGQPGNWTPTGAAPGAPWTPPGTPPPGGGWTPPPGTPPGGTYPGAPTTPPPSMSGATWIGDGPAGAVPVYPPGMSGDMMVCNYVTVACNDDAAAKGPVLNFAPVLVFYRHY